MHILLLATLFILFIQSDGFFFGFGGEGGGCSNCPCGTASPSCSMFCPQSHSLNCQQGQAYTGYTPQVQQNFNNQGGNFGNFGVQSNQQQYSNFANSYQQPPPQQFQQQMNNYPPRLPPYSPPNQFANSYLPPPPRNPIQHPTHEMRQQLTLGHGLNQHNQYQSIPRPTVAPIPATAPARNQFHTVSQQGPNESETGPQQRKQTTADEHAQIQSILEEHQKLVVPETKQETYKSQHGAPSPLPCDNQYQSISHQNTGILPEAPVVEQMEMMTESSSNYASTNRPMGEQELKHLSLQPPSSKIYSISTSAEHVSNETPTRKPEELSPDEIGRSIEDTYDEKSMTDEKLQITPLEEDEEEVFTPKENRPPIRTSMVTMSPNYDDKEYTEYLSSPTLTSNTVVVENADIETTRPYGVTFQYIQETTTAIQPNTVEYEIPVSKTYGRQSSVAESTTTTYIPIVPQVISTTANYDQITPTGYEFKNEMNEKPASTEIGSSETDVGLPAKEETTEEEGNPYTKFRDQKKYFPGDSKKKEVLYSTNHSDKDSYKRNIPEVPLDKCNNERLREIMNERMRPSASVSKQLIYASASSEFSGYSLNVICSRHSFSYIVVTSPIFCEHKKQNLTCFAFFQP